MKGRMGFDGFVWFFGPVEDRDDPLQLGRVRVRPHGIYSADQADVPTDKLPWATVCQPVQSAASAGVGISPTGIAVGSVVWGFFLDGKTAQQPFVVGTYAGQPGGNTDVTPLATGTNTITKGDAVDEPPSPYGAEYPYNKVTTTESGHIIEIDDTPGAERVHIWHKSGSYHEWGSDGTFVARSVLDDYDIVAGNKTVSVQGNLTINVKGNVNLSIEGNVAADIIGTVTVDAGGAVSVTAPSITITEA